MPEPAILGEGRWVRLLSGDGWEWVTRTRGALAVAVIAVTERDELVLVEQHRIPVGTSTIELPAGLVEDIAAEAPEEAARRELLEETGFCAPRVREVARGTTSAGITDEQIVLYVAEGLHRVGPGGGDASEAITVHLVPLSAVESWLAARSAAGALVDLKVYAGLHFARARERGPCAPPGSEPQTAG